LGRALESPDSQVVAAPSGIAGTPEPGADSAPGSSAARLESTASRQPTEASGTGVPHADALNRLFANLGNLNPDDPFADGALG